MLQASKATMVADFHKNTLDVRQLEISYYVSVFNQMAGTATFLSGFASSSLSMDPEQNNPFLVILFLISTCCCFGSLFLVTIVATMCVMWGPGHALQGDDADFVNKACDVLETCKTSMEKFFILGILCYFFSSFAVVWLLFDTRGAMVITVFFVAFVLWLFIKSWRIVRSLAKGSNNTGRVMFNPVHNIGKLMGDGTLAGEAGVSPAFASTI
eukprot:TRINITY_DN45464_c0_g1_i1.p1 TRINITY_DN45464_c0_g1~~TRINITY_DN45464_c0_g1_i1.p1  ORF type:complete len:212 (+),score=38.36 TRINITY_DN45464_c0_g1_i1:78-713(+)